ncbi:hypothetical protein [Rhodanobacter sp. L36]|uniref:hypothetical protein n=1 Tax=Rhodanobacter sp. L36 TaxID=1747221 RepID=UPI00131AADA4|nr:hypothetical protein [Rhodanobacter sp. L36]
MNVLRIVKNRWFVVLASMLLFMSSLFTPALVLWTVIECSERSTTTCYLLPYPHEVTGIVKNSGLYFLISGIIFGPLKLNFAAYANIFLLIGWIWLLKNRPSARWMFLISIALTFQTFNLYNSPYKENIFTVESFMLDRPEVGYFLWVFSITVPLCVSWWQRDTEKSDEVVRAAPPALPYKLPPSLPQKWLPSLMNRLCRRVQAMKKYPVPAGLLLLALLILVCARSPWRSSGGAGQPKENPHPVQRHKLVLTTDAPGPWNYLKGTIVFGDLESNCAPPNLSNDSFPVKTRDIKMVRINNRTWETYFYLDQLVNEDYYGYGKCSLVPMELNLTFDINSRKIYPFISLPSTDPSEWTNILYVSKRDYQDASSSEPLNFILDEAEVLKNPGDFYKVTVTALKAEP